MNKIKYLTIISIFLSLGGFLNSAESKNSKKAFFEGYQLLQKGDIEKAIILFNQAVKDSPNHAPTYSKLADCYEKTGKYKLAAPHWRKYIELRPRLAKRIGKHLELLDKMEEAEKELVTIRELEAKLNLEEQAKEKPSEELLKEQKEKLAKLWEGAEKLLLEVSEDTYRGSCIAERSINILIPRLVEDEKFEKSLHLIKRAVREYPDLLTPQMYLFWGVSLSGCSDFTESIQVLSKAEQLFKGDPVMQKECRRQTALALMEYGKNLLNSGSYLPARSLFKTLKSSYLSSLKPKETLLAQKYMLACEAAHVTAWISKGDSYASQGMFEDAIRWYSKIYTLSFSNAITYQAEARIKKIEGMAKKNLKQIDILIAKKNFSAAMSLADSVAKRYPVKYKLKAMSKYTDAAIAGRQFDAAARKYFEMAQKYHSREEGIIAYSKVGYLYGITMKKPKQGLALFQQMSKWQPQSEAVQREANLGTGIMLAILGKKEEALKLLTAVAIKHKNNKRIVETCKAYIWKCKNCEELAL